MRHLWRRLLPRRPLPTHRETILLVVVAGQAGVEWTRAEENEAADIVAAATVTWLPPVKIVGGVGLMAGGNGEWTTVGKAHQLLRDLRPGKPRGRPSVSHPARPPPTARRAISTTLTYVRRGASSAVVRPCTGLTATRAALGTRMLVPPST